MTNQAPPPFIPPLTPQQYEASNTRVALYLTKLGTFTFDTAFDVISGFKSLPGAQRLAFYRGKEAQFGDLNTWMTQPNMVPREPDEQGQPQEPIPAPPLMELSALTCAWMLDDAGKLFREEEAKLGDSGASLLVEPQTGGIPK